MCGTPWRLVAHEFKLTNKVTADKEGAGPPLPRIVVERIPEAEPRRFYVLSAATSRLTVTLEVVRVVQRWHRVDERSNHTTMNVENESERLLREP